MGDHLQLYHVDM